MFTNLRAALLACVAFAAGVVCGESADSGPDSRLPEMASGLVAEMLSDPLLQRLLEARDPDSALPGIAIPPEAIQNHTSRGLADSLPFLVDAIRGEVAASGSFDVVGPPAEGRMAEEPSNPSGNMLPADYALAGNLFETGEGGSVVYVLHLELRDETHSCVVWTGAADSNPAGAGLDSRLLALASGLAADMLSNSHLRRKLAGQFPGRIPVVSMPEGAVQNRTCRRGADLASLARTLRLMLANSGRFAFSCTTAGNAATAQTEENRGSVSADALRNTPFDRQFPADYILHGTLGERRESGEPAIGNGFWLSMQLCNVKTVKLDWAGASSEPLVSGLELDFAADLASDMLSNPGLRRKLAEQFPGRIPLISMPEGAVKDATGRTGFDLAFLAASFRIMLIDSGVFEFVDTTADAMVAAETMRDRDPAFVDANRAVAFGWQATADYILYGSLAGTQQPVGGATDIYYKLTMQLRNKKKSRIDWAGEREVVVRTVIQNEKGASREKDRMIGDERQSR